MFNQSQDNQVEPGNDPLDDPLDIVDVLTRATAPYVPTHRADVPVDSVSAVA